MSPEQKDEELTPYIPSFSYMKGYNKFFSPNGGYEFLKKYENDPSVVEFVKKRMREILNDPDTPTHIRTAINKYLQNE